MTSAHDDPLDLHRIFGMVLTDVFVHTPFVVELERDLSQQQQLLDVVIVRRGRGRFAGSLPDGLGDLVEHNLITFKSHQEALDDWAIRELVSHYVAYRKLVSPRPSALLPEDRFRLYAVCARFPRNLSVRIPWRRLASGVYDCHWGLDLVRVVVAGQLPREIQNTPLHFFSASQELVNYAGSRYEPRSPLTSRVFGTLLQSLRREGFNVSFTIEDFNRLFPKSYFAGMTPEERRDALEVLPPDERRRFLEDLSPEERLEGMSPEQRLQGISPEQRLEGMSPEQRLEGMSPEQRLEGMSPEQRLQGISPEQRLEGLSTKQIQQYLERFNAENPEKPRKSRKKK